MEQADESDQPADAALRDSDERFRLLLESLPHIAFVVFRGGVADHYNQRFIDYVGFLPGRDSAARTALHHPDDRAALEAARDAGVASDAEYIVEARLRRHDGVYRWHRLHNIPLIRTGVRIGYLGTSVDIDDVRQANELLERRVLERTAELRESEARYRMLYNRTPMALHSVDAGAKLLDVNDTWVELFGWGRDEVIGRSPADFMTDESAAVYRGLAWPEMLGSSGQARAMEYRFVTRSGRVFDGRLAARGEFGKGDTFVRSWAAIADITAEKRADRELQRVQRMEAVGQLTAGIAHDFNNLLTAILGNLELLAKRATAEPRAVRLIEGARAAAQRGARLTSQLLAFSRQQRIAAEPLDLDRVIAGMQPLLQSTIGAGVDVRIVPGRETWPATADPTQLELAILNLAINARDAMLHGGVITISTANVTRGAPGQPEEPEAGDYVAVSVADTGSGVPEKVRERMFEPFFTTKEVGKGSGLGLSQVLGVVKQLGGGITVTSVAEEGACISLFLPRAEAAATVVQPAGASAAEAVPARRLRILVVDDDAGVRTIAAEMLRDAGHEVAEAGSGTEALELLQAEGQAEGSGVAGNGGATGRGTELLLVDVVMPGMNGVELVRAVRRIWPALPALYMTGYADEGLFSPGTAQDVLRKPFKAAELAAMVARAAAHQDSAQ